MDFIQERIFKLTDCPFKGNLKTEHYEGVYVSYDGHDAVIGYSTKPQFARGCMLLAKAISEGKTQVEITEVPHFKSCGVMLDMSRNGVMRVSRVKEYLDFMSALGMNLLMLYTEDTYEVDGYDRFGYLRGRYSVKELKEIDDYAFSLGIEVVPCIQTLAHLEHFTKWGQGAGLQDVPSILCVGNPKVYEFIEACVKTVRSAFRSNRIHIGMDEAFSIGRGTYLDANGIRDRKQIVTDHLIKVTEICNKYEFRPMIWSDMYFRTPGRVGDFHLDTEVAPEIAKQIPDVDLVFWDYYNTLKEHYDGIFEKHKALNRNCLFAGGIWTWTGFLPDSTYTDRATPPALKSAIEKGTDTVFATLWSNDGTECNHFLALSQLAYFSEYCYKGADVTSDEIYETGAFLSGLDRDFYTACGDFTIARDVSADPFMLDYYASGKKFIWADILYGMHGAFCTDPADYSKKMSDASRLMTEKAQAHDKNEKIYRYASEVFFIAGAKCKIFYEIFEKYKSGDREYFGNLANITLPDLKKHFEELMNLHTSQWLETYKPSGLEVLQSRYASTLARLDYTTALFEKYSKGEINHIEEFDFNHSYGHGQGKDFKNCYTPCW